jgi:hypothetical protein
VNRSFQAKSAGISLVIIFAISLYYFANVLAQVDIPLPADAALPVGLWQLSITTLILLIVAEVVLHIVLTIGAGSAAASAKPDSEVVSKAMRNAYFVLGAGVLVSFGTLFFNASAFVMSHILLLFFVLAELTKFASQLLYYRRKR